MQDDEGSVITLVDTTLRDGEQAPGVAFSAAEKVEIASMLSSIGIREMEVGTPAMGGSEVEAVREILSMRLSARVLTWNRALERDIEASLSCGVRAMYISCPVSDIQIERKLRKNRDWVMSRFARLVRFAQKEGCYVACGLEDASRANPSFLIEVCRFLEGLNVRRLRICDTVGILSPFKFFDLIKKVKEAVEIPIEVHTHNDFGLATANALAGIGAGAPFASVTVNGLGERAGNAPLEEVAMALEKIEGIKTGVDIKRLGEISLLVSRFSGRPVPISKPIVGRFAFCHESGVHVDGVLKDPSNYEPFPPEEAGAVRRIMIGKHSSARTVIRIFAEMGIPLNKDQVLLVMSNIRRNAEKGKRTFAGDDLPAFASAHPDIA